MTGFHAPCQDLGKGNQITASGQSRICKSQVRKSREIAQIMMQSCEGMQADISHTSLVDNSAGVHSGTSDYERDLLNYLLKGKAIWG